MRARSGVRLRVAVLLVVLGGLWCGAFGAPARAQGQPPETVLERIERTGVLRGAARGDAVPISFRDGSGALIGLSVDLMDTVRQRLERDLGRSIELQVVEVTSVSRFSLLIEGQIDIECGITTATWDREEIVDFSIPFFENATRILSRHTVARSLSDFEGRRVGVVSGGTTGPIVTRAIPGAEIVEFDTLDAAFIALERDEIQGVSNIGVVLRAFVEDLPLKAEAVLLPRTGGLSFEPIACMLPQGDPTWRFYVNRTIADMLEGITEFRGPYYSLYQTWFGPRGPVFHPLDRRIAERLAGYVMWMR